MSACDVERFDEYTQSASLCPATLAAVPRSCQLPGSRGRVEMWAAFAVGRAKLWLCLGGGVPSAWSPPIHFALLSAAHNGGEAGEHECCRF